MSVFPEKNEIFQKDTFWQFSAISDVVGLTVVSLGSFKNELTASIW
jgi:hypothetical protein